MKVSIVTPIYNEEKNIVRYFEAIKKLKYPRDDFQLIFVNDGSGDSSVKMLREIKANSALNIVIIEFEKNCGRAIAREEGAKKAKYENILFLDCKCEIFPDALGKFKEKKYDVVKCDIPQKSDNNFDRFFLLIRNKVYKKNFGKNFSDTYITRENFDQMAKGTTALFCDKTTFLNSQPDNKHDVRGSDDIKLLWEIVQKKNILTTCDIKAYYNTRPSIKENIKHIFNRGHTFVDYYYKPGRRCFYLINLSLFIFAAIIIFIIQGLYLKEIALTLLTFNTILALYLAQNIKDFFISFTMFPFLGTIFFTGVIKKVISKIWA